MAKNSTRYDLSRERIRSALMAEDAMDPRKSDFSPYFEQRAKQKRICPKCHKRALHQRHSLSPNGAYDVCECGYFQSVSAPCKAAEVEWDGKAPWRNPNKRHSKIIVFSDLTKRGR